MDLRIPAGGVGQAIQQTGGQVTEIGRTLDIVQANFDYNDTASLKHEADLKKQEHYINFWQKEDGSDPEAVNRYSTELDKIDKEYIGRAYKVNNRVGGYFEKDTGVSTAHYTGEGQKQHFKKFYEKSMKVDMEETDRATKRAVTTGELFLEMDKNKVMLNARRPIYGNNVDGMITSSNAYMVENFITGRMSNRITAAEFLKRTQDDPQYKQELYKHLSADRVDDVERHLEAMAKALESDKRHDEIEMRRAEKEAIAAQHEEINQSFVTLYANGKLRKTDVLKSGLDATKKKQWIEDVDRQSKSWKADAGSPKPFKTDDTFEGQLYITVLNEYDTMTEMDIARHIGSKLTKDDAGKLINELRRLKKGEADPERHEGEKIIMKNLQEDYKDGLFGDDAEGVIEYTHQVQAFKKWSRKNPDKPVTEYYDRVIKPSEQGRISKLLDRVRGVDRGTVQTRRQEIMGFGDTPQNQFNELPDPAPHKGKTATDTETGKKYKSDGKKWIEVK